MNGVTVVWDDGARADYAEAWLDDEVLVLRGFDGQRHCQPLLALEDEELARLRVLAGPGTLLPYIAAAVDERVAFGLVRDEQGQLHVVREGGVRTGVLYDGDVWRSEAGFRLNQPLFGSLPLPAPPPGPRSRLSPLAAR